MSLAKNLTTVDMAQMPDHTNRVRQLTNFCEIAGCQSRTGCHCSIDGVPRTNDDRHHLLLKVRLIFTTSRLIEKDFPDQKRYDDAIYIYIKNYQNMLNTQNEIRKEDKMNLSYLWDRGPCLQTTSKPKIPLESMHLGQQDCKTNLQTMTNWMLIGCSLHVRCMCIACSSHVQGMVIKCSSHVHCMFVAYSLVIVGWYCLHVLQTSRCAILMCFLRHKQSQCGHCQAMPPNGNLDTEKTH